MTSTLQIPVQRSDGAGGDPSILLLQLDVEWAHLRTSRLALRTARSWAAQRSGHPLAHAVDGLSDLDDLLRATHRSTGPGARDGDGDAILLALVELARHDELAGRVVLQRVLPALIVNARRYRSYTDRTDPIAQIVPAAWIAIRCYDVERRCRHVAASLISDAVFQAFRRQLRSRRGGEEPMSPTVFASTVGRDDDVTALEELVAVLRDARRAGVPAADLDLLCQLVRVGSPTVVARERKVTTRAVRYHRTRAVRHVRDALAVAA
jgi:hypothetical protein